MQKVSSSESNIEQHFDNIEAADNSFAFQSIVHENVNINC